MSFRGKVAGKHIFSTYIRDFWNILYNTARWRQSILQAKQSCLLREMVDGASCTARGNRCHCNRVTAIVTIH